MISEFILLSQIVQSVFWSMHAHSFMEKTIISIQPLPGEGGRVEMSVHTFVFWHSCSCVCIYVWVLGKWLVADCKNVYVLPLLGFMIT